MLVLKYPVAIIKISSCFKQLKPVSAHDDFSDFNMLMIVIIQRFFVYPHAQRSNILIRWQVHFRDRLIAVFDEV